MAAGLFRKPHPDIGDREDLTDFQGVPPRGVENLIADAGFIA